MTQVPKVEHEIRDPVHMFIGFTSDERTVIDSRPVQRLRHIHQLALTNLVYPGATHRRFEHALGTMHLASQVYDVLTAPNNITDEIRRELPEVTQEKHVSYWRSVIRMAALCHDLGHLPFSHAAEKQLLPEGWSHERISRQLILSDEMVQVLEDMTPPLRPIQVVKLAVGKAKASDLDFSLWEEILAEIITGDAFGVDRIDYLLRDSLHAGVAYGRFDHHRLVDTLRILPSAPSSAEEAKEPRPPSLGVQEGGLHAAEALLLARYFMFAQVYFHPVRRVYDLHLIQFLREWLPDKVFSIDTEEHLSMTDNDVFNGITELAGTPDHPAHEPARRIHRRQHYKRLFSRTPLEAAKNPEVVAQVVEAFEEEFGENTALGDEPEDTRKPPDFPVLTADGAVSSAYSISTVLEQMPVSALGYVFVEPSLLEKGQQWLANNREQLTAPIKEPDEEKDKP